MKYKKDTISFIIPCYNEEKTIKLIYDEIEKEFSKENVNLEIIYINDGSKDNTDYEIKKLIESKKNIIYINFSKNFGKESAIYAGLENSNGDYITIIDGDLQQPPSVVKKMYNQIKKDKNIDCIGTYQKKRKEKGLKSSLSKNFYKFANKITNIEFANNASDFRLFNRNVAEAILRFKEHNRFTKGIFSWVGFNTQFIEYEPNEREFGETKWSLKKLFNYALDGILSYSNYIIKIPYIGGTITILISFILIILAFIKKISFIYPLITLTFSINSIFIGIIGTYIMRIYTESIDRPIYIAKEILSCKEKIK